MLLFFYGDEQQWHHRAIVGDTSQWWHQWQGWHVDSDENNFNGSIDTHGCYGNGDTTIAAEAAMQVCPNDAWTLESGVDILYLVGFDVGHKTTNIDRNLVICFDSD